MYAFQAEPISGNRNNGSQINKEGELGGINGKINNHDDRNG